MQYISYIFIYTILKLLSLLPMHMLYVISDFLYVIVFRLVKYRVKVVDNNIQMALPSIKKDQRQQIVKTFYAQFCDIMVEMIKTLSISEKEIKKRFQFTNIQLLHAYKQKNKSIVIMAPHYASWEWGIILGKYVTFKVFAVYTKLQNKYFDQLVRKIRSKFNAELHSTTQAMKAFAEFENNNQKGIYVFLSDQSPMRKPNNHWEKFMGIEVPVHMGAEAFIRKHDLNVLYMKISKRKRGYYQVEFVEFAPNPLELEPYELTRRFLDLVEEQIKKNPALYFWTHKRWKHRRN